MTLIAVLLALALEHFFGALDELRQYGWFDTWVTALEKRFAGSGWWDGAPGVLATLAVPLVVVLLAGELLAHATVILVFLLATVVLIYSFGPDLNTRLDRYLEALQANDAPGVRDAESRLLVADARGDTHEERVTQSILLRAHDDVFAVLFWFFVLGMTGALLFCLSRRLHERFAGIRGGYADAARNLYLILSWPSARLQALAMALAGSLVDALNGWRAVGGAALESSRELIGAVGIGALHLRPDPEAESGGADARIEWVQETQALANRTLIIWLTVLGLMTIRGWFG